MEVYKAETQEILRRFVTGRIAHQECVAALDAALAGVFLKLTATDLLAVQFEVEANNRKVAAEVMRREPPPRKRVSQKIIN